MNLVFIFFAIGTIFYSGPEELSSTFQKEVDKRPENNSASTRYLNSGGTVSVGYL